MKKRQGMRKLADLAGLSVREFRVGAVLLVSLPLLLASATGARAETGSILWEYWTGVGGTAVSEIPVDTTPSGTAELTSLQTPNDWGDNYGSRIRGYLVPPITGNYTFWISSDDSSELWLSTDWTSANKVRVAYLSGHANKWEWRAGPEKSTPIALEAGAYYYIEVLHKEGNGADHLMVGWAKPGEGTGGPTEIVPGSALAQQLPPVVMGRSQTATGVTGSQATLNGMLLHATDTNTTSVSVYWGTTDGGTDAANWTGGTNTWPEPCEPGAFAHVATGLATNALYFFRFSAVVAATNVYWADASATLITAPVALNAVSNASEVGQVAGLFRVTRPDSVTNAALVVNYTVGGTAVADVNYAALSGSVVIPGGQTSADIVVTPLNDWATQSDTSLELTLAEGGYLIGAPSAGAIVIFNQALPGAPTNAWIAAEAGNASVAANWSLGHVPTAAEDILLTGFSVADMTWDAGVNGLSTNVASWTQDTNYTGNVFVDTPFAATDPILVVEGDVVLDGGAWMHTGNQTTETTKLFARVNGDLMIGANASINVFAKGFRGTSGPGYVAGGSAHGGEGATMNSWTKTYGSVFRPDRWGSGGGKTGYPGGGLAQLEVGGALTVNGSINANGHGVYNNNGAGGGGSILLTVGSLEGGGTISADGGLDDWSGNGGGGRVAIYLQNAGASRSQFAGSVSARGVGNQKYNQGSYESGCGTVYWQTVQDGEGGGTVYVWNPLMLNRTSTVRRSCHLPPALGTTENFGRSHWVIQENAHLKLMDDARVASLTIAPSSNPSALGKLNLNNRTLRTKALTILGTSYPAGTYAAADFPEGRVIDGSGETPGQVVVLATGTILTVR